MVPCFRFSCTHLEDEDVWRLSIKAATVADSGDPCLYCIKLAIPVAVCQRKRFGLMKAYVSQIPKSNQITLLNVRTFRVGFQPGKDVHPCLIIGVWNLSRTNWTMSDIVNSEFVISSSWNFQNFSFLGLYECQMSTEPKISKLFRLNVTGRIRNQAHNKFDCIKTFFSRTSNAFVLWYP